MAGQHTFAYVVLCHHKAEQALRLARTIRATSPHARVLLRHDRVDGYISAEDAHAAGADLLVSSIKIRWGHWSMVEASVEAFLRARELFRPEWTVLVSGQHYPVRRLAEWEAFVLSSGSDAVVSSEPLVAERVPTRFRDSTDRLRVRYTHRWYWLPRLNLPVRLPDTAARKARVAWYGHLEPLQAVIALSELPRGGGWAVGFRRWNFPFSSARPARKGSQWLALSRSAVDLAVHSSQARRWQRWYRRTLVPDESYFHTVLEGFPEIRIQRSPITWERWSIRHLRSHPEDLTHHDLDAAHASGCPFARKFDEARTPGILDAIDRRLFLGSARL